MVDVGLLGAMSDLPPEAVIAGSRVFTELKGALTEQYKAAFPGVCNRVVSPAFDELHVRFSLRHLANGPSPACW